MRTYINLRKSEKSHANWVLRQLGKLLDAGECRREQTIPAATDLLIQWGFKPTRSLISAIAAGIPYVIIDLGYIDATREKRFSISINGLHGTAWRDPKVLDRAPRLTPTCRDWRSGAGSKVIVIGQMPLDQSLRGQDIEAWAGRVAVQAAEAFKRPVIKRPHPKMLNTWEPFLEPLERVLEDAYAVVTCTSTAAIGSVLRGIPTVAMHPGNMAYRMAAHDMTLRTPPGRDAWLHEICWRDWGWSPDELDQLAAYIAEIYPSFKDEPLDSPRNLL